MKSRVVILCILVLAALPALASALGSSGRAMIPANVQQIISVDYRTLRNSPSAMALKDRVLPDNLKQFESSLQSAGIASNEIEHITFASVRSKEGGPLRLLGVADGSFQRAKVLQRLRAQKTKPTRYHDATFYPMGNGMEMMFADNYTLVFGDPVALRQAVDAREGTVESLASNSQMTDMMASVESGAVWSVLDAVGTQTLMRSALGQAAQLGEYESVRKRLLGSRYTMDFSSGVDFDMNVLTSDQMTAATLSSLVQAGVLYRKMQAQGAEKAALENLSVNSDNDNLRLRFKSDDAHFQALMKSDLFKAVAH